MSRESEVAAYMQADATLMAILLGGVYAFTDVGRIGISRENEATQDAFDAENYLLPCALVRQAGLIMDGQLVDDAEPIASGRQRVEIWLYEDSGYDNIDAALNRLFVLMQGHAFNRAYPANFSNPFNRQQDLGALKGASLARADISIPSIRGQQ